MIKALEAQNQIQFDNYRRSPVILGPFSGHMWKIDPKHMGFVFARYKFVSKILAGKKEVLEIGCGDAFATPIVAGAVERVFCVDWEPILIEDNIRRCKDHKNISFSLLDITKTAFKKKCDGVFALDVIEHIKPEDEHKFWQNICRSLKKDGICVIGTPNVTAHAYASELSREGHVNMKSYKDFQNVLKKYFHNYMLFSMNDEVVHTGFYPMAHYLIAVGIGPK